MPFDAILMAFDYSVRTYDREGRLHVGVSHITKACVNGYRGNEIPGYQQLGLDPNRTYMLLRHPTELEKAAPTFNNIQVLDQHIPVTAHDEQRERVIGSTGTDAAWRAPYLDNSLVFWSDHAIAMIESGEMRELSSAYRYTPVMTPGVYLGERYDGVMTDIIGNHVALVETGRAGSDVVVMDSKPREIAMKNLSLRGAFIAGKLEGRFAPLMAQDKKPPDMKPFLLGTSAKNWATDKPKVVAAIQRATKGMFANDAEVHIHEHLDGASAGAPDDVAPGDPGGVAGAAPGAAGGGGGLAVGGAASNGTDPNDNGNGAPAPGNGGGNGDVAAVVQTALQGKVDDNTLAIILQALKQPPDQNGGGDPDDSNGGGADQDDDDEKKPVAATDEEGVIPKLDTARKDTPAMDKKPITKVAMDAAIADAVAKVTKRLNARDDAKNFVRPWVGEIAVAMDSATEVLKFALEQMGEDVTDIHPSAFKALLGKIPKPGEQQPSLRQPIAMDASGSKAYLERFPNANRLMKH